MSHELIDAALFIESLHFLHLEISLVLFRSKIVEDELYLRLKILVVVDRLDFEQPCVDLCENFCSIAGIQFFRKETDAVGD